LGGYFFTNWGGYLFTKTPGTFLLFADFGGNNSNSLTVRNLALQYPKSSLNTGPLLIYLTARSSTRGEEAVKTLLADPQLKAAKALTQDGGLSTITFGHLDITDESSIRYFKDFVKKGYPDGIDILANNAGIYIDASGKIFKRSSQLSREIRS